MNDDLKPKVNRTLEIEGDVYRNLVEQALARIEEYYRKLPNMPAFDIERSKEVALSVSEPLPEQGTDFETLLAKLFDEWIPCGFNTASPGYFAYIPGGGIPHASVADFIAAAVNRYVGVWQAAPALAQLEATVVGWICEMLGYPVESRGYLTTGGSLANWSAIVTARCCRLPENFQKGTIYLSDQTHHSLFKAIVLAGFPRKNVRTIETDERCCIVLDCLEEAIEKDRAEGFEPFLIVGNAGTTNTGAVDDLNALADVAEKEKLWLHLDAAYGGFFVLTERGKKTMEGIERADSITIDPHKGMFLPYGTGALIVRDGENLKRAHSQQADYMPQMQNDNEFVDFCEITPELSRGFRGLRLWLPLKMHGIGPFRENLDEKLDLIEYVHEELSKMKEIEIVAEPQLTVVAFRWHKPGLTNEELNAWNQKFLERINSSKRFYLTPTVLRGMFVIRVCLVSFRSHKDRVDECLSEIRRVIDSMNEAK